MVTEELREAIKLNDWWLRGSDPSEYTTSVSREPFFNLDKWLSRWADGQMPLARDITDFYAKAIHSITREKRASLIAFISRNPYSYGLGVVPLTVAISNHERVGLPYIIVQSEKAQHSIETGGEPMFSYLRGATPVIISDEVLTGDEILNVNRILKLYGANNVEGAVCLVARTDVRTQEPLHPKDYLELDGIQLLYSHEMWLDNGILAYNPNQKLSQLTTTP